MDSSLRSTIIAEARVYWDRGYPIKTGMLIFERIPLEFRAAWSADILEFAYRPFEPISEIDAVLEFARNPEQWPVTKARQAHDLFGAVRRRSLELPEKTEFDYLVSTLAEHTTGITYTSRQYPAPFDHNRGWRIVEIFKNLIALISLDEFDAWQILVNENYLLLDFPIICHPGCPVCFHPDSPKWDYLPEIKV